MMTMTQKLRAALTQCGKSPVEISEATGIPRSALRRFVGKGGGLKSESFDRLVEYMGLAGKTQTTPRNGPLGTGRAAG